ncbi:MAG: heme-binding protein, partial [Rhodospirillaceae bacterium]
TPEMALELARAILADCRKRGYQVAVSVVDRSGVEQIMLRDRFAGPHTPETARLKAYTAASFRTDTQSMMTATQAGEPQSGIRHRPGTLMVGGGVPVDAGGTLVGAVGVSGAPGGDMDDACARVGIEAMADKLAF